MTKLEVLKIKINIAHRLGKYDKKNKFFIEYLTAHREDVSYIKKYDRFGESEDQYHDLILIKGVGVIPVPVLYELIGHETYRKFTSGIKCEFHTYEETEDDFKRLVWWAVSDPESKDGFEVLRTEKDKKKLWDFYYRIARKGKIRKGDILDIAEWLEIF